jgi:hypothetical protein
MPYSLSEEQIDFILSDIKARGIEIEKLQINLLDHVCCLLEERMNNESDFKIAYSEIIEEFHENGLKGVQKETSGLLRSRNFYRYKLILYTILIGSLSYNVFEGVKAAASYLKFEKEHLETHNIDGITLEQGYKDLRQKILLKYPGKKINEYIVVDYEFHDDLDPLPFTSPWDTSITHKWENYKKYQYREMDLLAEKYPNVTFVMAYQRTNETTDKIIAKYSVETQNLIYLKDMNKLLSGYYNFKKYKGWQFPTLFILDKNGQVVYEPGGVEREFYINRFLKTLPK